MSQPRVVAFLVIVLPHENTRFAEDLRQSLIPQIQQYVQRLAAFHTEGPIPAVEVKAAPDCFKPIETNYDLG